MKEKPVVGQFELRVSDSLCFRILKGFKSIAVGEPCDAHGGSVKRFPDPGRVKQCPENVTLSGSVNLLSPSRGRRATLAHGY